MSLDMCEGDLAKAERMRNQKFIPFNQDIVAKARWVDRENARIKAQTNNQK